MVQLNENALTTLSRVALELDITPGEDADTDTLLKHYINAISDEFQQATGRQFYNKQGHEETAKGYSSDILMVKDHVPIDTITKIEYDDGETTIEIDAEHYEIEDADAGMIRRISGLWKYTGRTEIGARENSLHGTERGLYKVTYDGGFVTPQQAFDDNTLTRDLPSSIEQAVVTRVVQQYRKKGRDLDVISESLGDATVRYAGYTSGSAKENMSNKIWTKAISRYRFGGFR